MGGGVHDRRIVYTRPPEQIGECFEGLEMVAPGLVSITQWRPDNADVGNVEPIEHYGAVARKP